MSISPQARSLVLDQAQLRDIVRAAVDAKVSNDGIIAALDMSQLSALVGPGKLRIIADGGIKVALQNALTEATNHDRLADFLSALVVNAPQENKLLAVTSSLVALSGEMFVTSGLEIMLTGEKFVEPLALARKLIERARQICTVESAEGLGTGFLIGRDRVLTAGHVVRKTTNVTCRFDFFESARDREFQGEARPSSRHDYALVLLDTAVGAERLESGERGWIDITKARRPKVEDRVIVLQHPEESGAQQRLRMHVGAVKIAGSEMLTYDANTRPGSSGGPVFDLEMEVVGLHVKAGNVGIAIDVIAHAIATGDIVNGIGRSPAPSKTSEALRPSATRPLREQLDTEIEKHEAFDHGFLQTTGWDMAQIKVIAPDYLAFIKAFPRALTRLIAHVDDEPSRIFLTSILHEELGAGNPNKVHHRLLSGLLTSELKLQLEDIDSPHLLVTTMRLLSEIGRLYSHSDVVVAVGAQYALEKQATGMLVGVERGFSAVLKRRDVEYFEVHRTQEPEHHGRMIECLHHHVTNESELDRARTGALQLMSALNRFWSGIRDNVHGEPQSTEHTSGDKLLAFENELLMLLVNRLSPQRNVRLDRLRELGGLDARNPYAVSDALGIVLKEASLVLEPHLRIYLAVKLEESPLLRMVKSYSQNDPRWLHRHTAESNSNIAYVYRSMMPRCHDDTLRISDLENQRTLNEGSVAAFPIVVEADAEKVCVAVLELSSPGTKDIQTGKPLYLFGLRLALHLGVLVGLYVSGQNKNALNILNEILLKDVA